MKSTLVLMALVVGLVGCASGNCDPDQAGFIGGIGCQASGAYGQRTQSLQAQLSASRSAALQERAAALSAQQDAAASETALAERRQQLQAIDRQNAVLQRKLRALQASNRIDKARLAKANAELASVKQQRATAGPNPDDAELRDLQQHQQRLQNVVSSLGDL